MKSLKCPNCGGPVAGGDAEADAKCSFCGATFQRESRSGAGIRIDARGLGDGLRRLARGVMLVAAGLLAIGLASAIGLSIWATRSHPGPSMPAPGGVRPVPVAEERPLRVDELAALASSRRFEVAVALPPGGLAEVDGVAALPWALAVAQRWAPDARPTRVDVARLRPDGTVNAADDRDAEVLWRFESPTRRAAFRARADLESKAQGRFEFFVFAREGKVLVQSIETSAMALRTAGELPPYPSVPPLTETLRLANRSPTFPRVPFYSGYLLHLEREGWCWYLSTLSGEPSIPRLRARDGKFFPYRS